MNTHFGTKITFANVNNLTMDELLKSCKVNFLQLLQVLEGLYIHEHIVRAIIHEPSQADCTWVKTYQS